MRLQRWIFVSCFVVGCLTGFGLLLSPWTASAIAKFSSSLVAVSGALISLCGGHALVEGTILRDPSSGFGIQMKDGCNAANVTVFLWSAVLAFPASWRMKVWGLLAGSFAIHAVNIVRFISLYYLGLYSLSWFEFAHAYLWESLIILDTVVIFWLWVNRVSRTAAGANAER